MKVNYGIVQSERDPKDCTIFKYQFMTSLPKHIQDYLIGLDNHDLDSIAELADKH